MIEFLYGDYGSGKTSYIVDKIRTSVSKNERCIWLVPEQKTVLCERTLAQALPPSAQLLCEALSFSRLANKVAREYGGLRHNYIARSGKSLIMYSALCEVRENLTEYKLERGKERGCVDMFLDVIGELKSYAISPSALLSASEGLENEHLKRRIHDLVCVFEAYERILQASYDDPYDDIIMLSEKLDAHRFFEGVNVFINSFFGFTGAQIEVLKRIFAQAKSVTISFDLPLGDMDKIQYAKLSDTVRKIKKICHSLSLIPCERDFSDDLLHKSEALSYLAKSIWRFDAPPMENHTGITLMRPENEFDECERVASKIKELIMGGERYSSIAIIMRNADTYRGVIDYTLKKYDIPFFMSARVDIASKPLIKMLYSVINASGSFSARDIASFMRSGYSGVERSDADELESYMYRWSIYGRKFEDDDYWASNPDGYVTKPTELQIERLKRINEARAHLISKISIIKSAFDRGASAREICLAIYELFTSLNIKDALRAEIASADKAEAMELSQLYSELLCALDIIVEILGERVLDRESFLSALGYVLGETSIGTIPTGEDNVTVGEAGALRTESIKYAFVLGVCEGEFPATINDAPFFSDSDKTELKIQGISLSETSDVRSDSELLNFKNSISMPSHELFVSSPRADIKGTKRSPSVAFLRILELFPTLKDTLDGDMACPFDKIYSPRIAREFASGNTPLAYAIRELLDIEVSELDFSNEDEKISPKIARELFGKKIYLSQSKIEKFVSCHFQYYCTYLLGIKESQKIAFGAREVGVLAHAVFESFLKRARDGKLSLDIISDAEIEQEIDQITEDYIRMLCQGRRPDARLRHLFSRLKSNIIIYIRELSNELSQGKFVPELFELPFTNDGEGVAPLSFDAGEGATITLSGVVDRVDVYRSGDTAYLRVVDYKTGDKKFSMNDFEHGLELQLLIYLFTLCKMDKSPLMRSILGSCTRLKPAGVVYFPMRLGKSRVDEEVDLSSELAGELEKKEIASLIKRNGVFLDDEEVILAQDGENSGHYVPKKTKRNEELFLDEEGFDNLYKRLEATLHRIGGELLSGSASARPLRLKSHGDPCEYCEHRALCRRRRA
ncbi:MAG: PD-(D/E)XK nuclease family protein [Clostridia bacterium]|nr:PD-(D/E)XK nuclease family protein [Clostridia bacterium]